MATGVSQFCAGLFTTLWVGKSTTKKNMILISKIALDRQKGLEYASDATSRTAQLRKTPVSGGY
jgi:hypothetical protein